VKGAPPDSTTAARVVMGIAVTPFGFRRVQSSETTTDLVLV
jgi:hypothetical protein